MRGFSLVELLVTMAIMGLLAALALPGYTRVVNRALRQDARLALLGMQHRQEVLFARNLRYSPDPALPARSAHGPYLLDLRVAADGMSYVVLAQADPAGRQGSDSGCAQLTLDAAGRRRSADASGTWRDDDPHRCWG